MPRVAAVRPLARNLDFLDVAETRGVTRRDRRAPRPEAVRPGELPEPERGGHVRHVVLEARSRDRIVPAAAGAEPCPTVVRHPVQAEAADGARAGAVLRRRHATLAR